MSVLRTESQIQDSLNSIMSQIRSTNLNYSIEETPFSTYITLRKSLNKAKWSRIHPWLNSLKIFPIYWPHCELLEQANDDLKHMFEEGMIEHETKVKVMIGLQDKIKAINARRELCKDEVETKAKGQMKAISEETSRNLHKLRKNLRFLVILYYSEITLRLP